MTTVHEILGATVAMPVVVRDASNATVIFDVPLEAAAALAPAGFEVVEADAGRAQLALTFVDYRDNDLGAYREVGTILFVRPEGGGEEGNFITHLPVSEEFSRAAGVGIWGYPKTVEQIEVTDTDTTTRWVLTMDGELVLDVTLPRGGTDEMPEMSMASYTLIDGCPHITRFSQGGSASSMYVDADVRLTLGSHPIAAELSSLGLPDAPVVLTTWTGRMRGRFEEPTPL